MRILIQQRGTGLFFKQMNEWTDDLKEAAVFPSALAAFKFSRSHSLEETEIVFQNPNKKIHSVLDQ
jgi:hypothetical protein